MIRKIKENIWQMNFQHFSSSVYLVKLPQPILIDTGSKEASVELIEDLKKLFIEPEDIESIILTHAHWDHDGNIDLFPKAKIYSSNNLEELKENFPDFKIYETPGHTRDSIVILYDDVLFSGDVIFDKNQNYVGRTDLPESVPEKMQGTLEFMKTLKYSILCPGHLV